MANRSYRLGSVVSALAIGAAVAAFPATAGAAPAAAGSAPPGALGVKLIHPSVSPAVNSETLVLRSSAKSGEAVAPQPKVYLVFWGSQWSSDPAAAEPALTAFFAALHSAPDTWGTILDQYCEGLAAGTTTCGGLGIHIKHPTANILAGVWRDNSKPAPASSSGAQVAAEAIAAAAHFHNTTRASNTDTQYVIASATGTHPDGFPNTGFCGYHDSATSGTDQVAFTNLPYVPDLGNGACTTLPHAKPLDGYFSTETHEYAETETDLRPGHGWTASGGSEIGDECVNLDATLKLAGKTYDVQGLWSNAAKACVTHG